MDSLVGDAWEEGSRVIGKISFFTHVVHIMAGGRSFGTITRYSLPGDRPEVWQVAFNDPDGVLSDEVKREGLSTPFASRTEAEVWATPHAIALVERWQAKAAEFDATALAELALT